MPPHRRAAATPRYSMRDLLWITTVAAVYFAALGIAWRSQPAGRSLDGGILFGGICGGAFGAFFGKRRIIAMHKSNCRKIRPLHGHLQLASLNLLRRLPTMTVVYTMLNLAVWLIWPRFPLLALLVYMPLFVGVGLLSMSRRLLDAVIGERGVLVYGHIVPWKRTRIIHSDNGQSVELGFRGRRRLWPTPANGRPQRRDSEARLRSGPSRA